MITPKINTMIAIIHTLLRKKLPIGSQSQKYDVEKKYHTNQCD
jgi:hypothetical protein